MASSQATGERKSGLFSRLRSNYQSLSATERRLADFLFSRSANVADLISVASLARQAGVSEASVVRFSRKIDYSGFPELKRALLDEALASVDPHDPPPLPYQVPGDADQPEDILRQSFALMRTALSDTEANLDVGSFTRAVNLIAESHRTVLFAHGGSGNIASDASIKFLLLGINSIAHVNQHTHLFHSEHLETRDVVIALSHTGTVETVLNSVRLAADKGAPIIAITGDEGSPIAQLGDVHLLTAVPQTSVGSDSGVTRVAQVAILDCLAVASAHQRARDKEKS